MLKKIGLLRFIVILLVSTGCSKSPKVQSVEQVPAPVQRKTSEISSEQLKVSRNQIDEALAELGTSKSFATLADAIGSFRPASVCKAGQLLQSTLKAKSLETADPKLAAKAHRAMAGVYCAAFISPRSKGDCIFELVVGDALTKAARELQVSLRLHPKQPEAAQVKQIIREINRGEDPKTDELLRYVKFCTENLGTRLSW